MKTHKTKQAALQAARKDMGPEAIEGTDFNIKNTGAGYTYEEIAQTAPRTESLDSVNPAILAKTGDVDKATITAEQRAEHLAEGRIQAKDIAGNEVWTLPSDPFLVDGVLYPNKTRAADAKRLAEKRAEAAASPTPIAAKAAVAKESVANKRAARKEAAAPKDPDAPVKTNKTDMIIAMLKRPGGATSKAMEDAAGWQPHSVRGLLGTLRGKGTAIVSAKEKGQPTVYSIAAAEPVGDVV